MHRGCMHARAAQELGIRPDVWGGAWKGLWAGVQRCHWQLYDGTCATKCTRCMPESSTHCPTLHHIDFYPMPVESLNISGCVCDYTGPILRLQLGIIRVRGHPNVECCHVADLPVQSTSSEVSVEHSFTLDDGDIKNGIGDQFQVWTEHSHKCIVWTTAVFEHAVMHRVHDHRNESYVNPP